MTRTHFTTEQREAILRAARDAEAHQGAGPYDAIDLASDTGNYWWTGLRGNAEAQVALRLVSMQLRRERREG